MRSKKSIGKVVLIILLGALFGSLLGELIGLVLPQGVVKEFFLRTWHLKIGPAELNAVLFSITFGFALKVNIIGAIGVAVAVYLLRWY